MSAGSLLLSGHADEGLHWLGQQCIADNRSLDLGIAASGCYLLSVAAQQDICWAQYNVMSLRRGKFGGMRGVSRAGVGRFGEGGSVSSNFCVGVSLRVRWQCYAHPAVSIGLLWLCEQCSASGPLPLAWNPALGSCLLCSLQGGECL
mgnify:CR=1 FL=1